VSVWCRLDYYCSRMTGREENQCTSNRTCACASECVVSDYYCARMTGTQ
jgi:hypothetical protein